ncbi:tyrosine-type recombinase/integrase [Lentzea sp. NEAU-D7]|uniref:tyrosine-type recombinase/integrase n=1 Tax=Lentzea sp. NEAU-D7 TaxID=2994667 RepID=UPI00224B0FC6|nr:tyrosine-type recombinase/integrase [Lentzea sp. NEAU-D7]MCX2949899.1 tyrosine-type recombinase/integrase [Lentzea sp. NEAU-D7]
MTDETSYDVQVFALDPYAHKGSKKVTYWVRWRVTKKRFKSKYGTKALAEAFRSNLIAAARKGEAFRTFDGLPVSMARQSDEMSWYQFACAFVDMKWPHVAATTRRTHAEALTRATPAMWSSTKGKPDDALIRSALTRWAFNTNRRDAADMPEEVRRTLRWVEANTLPVASLRDPQVLRPLLDRLAVKLDGKPAAPSVVSRQRKILGTAMEYAVERKLLDSNPIPALKWIAPRKTVQAVDQRRVANPSQMRDLLEAVRLQKRSGPRLTAFFGCLYYAGMRPEEAVALSKRQLSLPEEGWGEIHLEDAHPYAGKDWTDSGKNRDERMLKQRDAGTIRPVPSPPELTALLHRHMRTYGTARDGRLFRGERNDDELPKLTILRAWRKAREKALPAELAASDLAATPYDLRHAGISLWLSSGVPPKQVAEWAGHSLEVLFRIYAHVLSGSNEAIRALVEAGLKEASDDAK